MRFCPLSALCLLCLGVGPSSAACAKLSTLAGQSTDALSAKYSGDISIESDRAVGLYEIFTQRSMAAVCAR